MIGDPFRQTGRTQRLIEEACEWHAAPWRTIDASSTRVNAIIIAANPYTAKEIERRVAEHWLTVTHEVDRKPPQVVSLSPNLDDRVQGVRYRAYVDHYTYEAMSETPILFAEHRHAFNRLMERSH